MQPPILRNKIYHAESVFTAENMLREARRQKNILHGTVPAICILDPDGDIADHLVMTGKATRQPNWACYHTRLYSFQHANIDFGIVPHVVGASFAVLVAEELFACGCELIISVTSAGQILPVAQPPYFVLIDRALRDEGTSYHYLPPDEYCAINADLLRRFAEVFDDGTPRVLTGATWTTDGPFRETTAAIDYALSQGILGVEMEAAALYALAQARGVNIICFAHITNQMAQVEGDFEKGENQGSRDALEIIWLTAQRWQNGMRSLNAQ